MQRIIVINGLPGSGKDAFVQYVSKYAKTVNFSSIDFVREVATFAGWDGVKDDKGRLLLSQLKQLLTNYDNIPYEKTTEAIWDFYDSDNEFMFIHVREKENIEKLVHDFQCQTLLVSRKDNVQRVSNDSDRYVESYQKYDFYLSNESTLDDLDKKAEAFVAYLRGERMEND